MGIDGLSILLVLLTAFLTPIAILSTWTAVEERVKDFMLFFLLLEVGMMGVFLAQDLFLFYIFWEFTLVPMYFLIGIWGGPRRIYAAIKFFLYTMAGSLLMLLAILWLGLYTRHVSRARPILARGGIPAEAQLWLFIAFALAFAIKVPMWPLHSWLPDAHVEAPTAGSVILAGVLLKMGTYGFLRFNIPLFPKASLQAAPWIALLAVIGIIYGAVVSYAQNGCQETGRVLLGQPPRLCDAGFVRAQCAGHRRRDLADGQPRPQHRRIVPPGRHDLRADAHARAGCLRRVVEDHAGLRRDHR